MEYELRAKAVKQIQENLGIPDAFNRSEMSLRRLLALHQQNILEPFLEGRQNDAPSLISIINKLIKFDFQDRFTIEYYVVNTDRADTRFTVEGFSAKNLSLKEMQILIDEYNGADELETKLLCGKFRAWWD